MAKKSPPAEPLLAKGTKHWARRNGGPPCLAEIIDSRDTSDGTGPRYYVHYCNFDKRLDEWIGPEKFLSAAEMRKLGGEYFAAAEEHLQGAAKTLTRNLRKRFERSVAKGDAPLPVAQGQTQTADPMQEQLEREHEEATRVKNVQAITIGQWEIDCWYFSPFPDSYAHCDRLLFCERCLKYMRLPGTLAKHLGRQCDYQGPPGPLIYLSNGLAVYELDGAAPGRMKLYCQNACLLAKLFLDHKTIYYDVSPFLFYILCEADANGIHPVGFFSKEKDSADGYNLACIMVLPPYQRKGYGRFLMALSYEITRRQRRTGTPERPLSDLGLVSYRSFWARELLLRLRPDSTVGSLSLQTGFTVDDITDTLRHLELLPAPKDEPKAGTRQQSTIRYNARKTRELLETKYAKKPGAADFIPEALSWATPSPADKQAPDAPVAKRQKKK